MKHRTFAAAMGLLTALLVSGGPSVAAGSDPTGFWTKQEESDYPAKMEIRKCGKGQLCAKIIWLQVPNDSKGKALHDVRNEDPSMRDRPILGLPIFNGLSPAEPGVWTGDIYNPEDGHVYSDIKLTLVSRSQIVIRGCKAWLLCGEKIWTRTSAPPAAPAAEPEQQEVKAPATPPTEAPMVEAAAEGTAAPQAAPIAADPPSPPMPTPNPNHSAARSAPEAQTQVEANAGGDIAATESLPRSGGAVPSDTAKPALPSPWQHAAMGYDVLLTAAHPQSTPFSSESVSSIFVFIPRVASAAAASDTVTDAEAQIDAPAAVPLPAPKPAKPKAPPKPIQATANADPPAVPAAAPTVKPKPKPVVKQPEEDLPWLQHP